jgi:hypothetical protein
MAALVCCTVCARHVRITDPACPFCGASLEGLEERRAEPLPADRGLTRAAVVFMGAAALAGCGKTSGTKDPAPAPTEMSAPAYGPAPIADTDAGAAQPQAAPAYGVPPIATTSTAPDTKKP